MEDFPEDIEEFEPEETIPCECCDGTCYSMGFLGNLQWFRCLSCGMEQYRKEGR